MFFFASFFQRDAPACLFRFSGACITAEIGSHSECRLQRKELEFKDDLIDPEILPVFLMNYPFEQKRNLSFHIITPMLSTVKVSIEYKGTEFLSLGKDKTECYKLQMVPDLGFMGFVGNFMPATHFWFTASWPHRFVRYEGLEGGPKSPAVIKEFIN